MDGCDSMDDPPGQLTLTATGQTAPGLCLDAVMGSPVKCP